MGRFIVDFYCPQAKLVVEVDGDTHGEQAAYDAERTEWLRGKKRCQVLRFTNYEIRDNLDGVVETIADAVRAALS